MIERAAVGGRLRVLWSLSYSHAEGPGHTIPAAVALATPARQASAIATALYRHATRVTVGAIAGFAAEEHSADDAHLIATHVLWPIGSYLVWFTVYDTSTDLAVDLAQHVDVVSDARWEAATSGLGSTLRR
ncbi:MAG: hypothetical protein JF603_04855 [Acidobacteria bacterium]|nr:hypothetical protein [Acidobacteriota bacterium]